MQTKYVFKAVNEALEETELDASLDKYVSLYYMAPNRESVFLHDLTEIPSEQFEFIKPEETLYACIAEYKLKNTASIYYVIPLAVLKQRKVIPYTRSGNISELENHYGFDTLEAAQAKLQKSIEITYNFKEAREEFIEYLKSGELIKTQAQFGIYGYTILAYAFAGHIDEQYFRHNTSIFALIRYKGLLFKDDVRYILAALVPTYSDDYLTEQFMQTIETWGPTISYKFMLKDFYSMLDGFNIKSEVFILDGEQ